MTANQPNDRKGINPFLRWAGSKRKLLPILTDYWSNDYSRYVEPFAGSACLFFRVLPQHSIIGDINGELILTYRQVKKDWSSVASVLGKLRKGKITYLRLRETSPASLSLSERAARFIYLNRFCFNGLYRTNLRGQFNVPYSGDRTGEIPSAAILKQSSLALQNSRLVIGDFERVLQLVKLGDFVYMDPPFAVNARRVFKEYDSAGFGTDELSRLRRWMENFADRGIEFLVSYADSSEARILARGFYSRRIRVRRHIAGFAGKRAYSQELLISPNHPQS